jgi:hypothetical protein
LDEAIDEGEHGAEMVAGGADPESAHERRVEARDIGLHDPARDSRGEESE